VGPRILIVDDDPANRETLALLLRLSGCIAEGVANGREALDYLGAHPAPGLIFLDLMMPVMSGWDFLRRRREDAALTGVPVVVLSALGDSYRRDVLSLGADGCLQKPAEPELLLSTVRRY
jgi:CheY-like chemotaxis protein